jgi:hypothetical protein
MHSSRFDLTGNNILLVNWVLTQLSMHSIEPVSSSVSFSSPELGDRVGADQESCFQTPDVRLKSSERTSVFLLTRGGTMQRFLIALLLCLGLVSASSQVQAQFLKEVSGYLPAGREMVFHSRVPGNTQLDTIYRISGSFNISGRLVIQEGAEVQFLPNSRILDSTGGKIIANGFTGLNRRIIFRGQPVNQNSVEWGHFLVLPGADSVFFANVHFINFRKGNTVDNKLIYGVGPTEAARSIAITQLSNGTGGVMTTFSQRTWVWDAIVDGSQALYRGGAFAFLQAPTNSYFQTDDGRLALVRGQVGRLTIRDAPSQ